MIEILTIGAIIAVWVIAAPKTKKIKVVNADHIEWSPTGGPILKTRISEDAYIKPSPMKCGYFTFAGFIK